MSKVFYKIGIQYKAPGKKRPYDDANEIVFPDGQYCPLPHVGDAVIYRDEEGNQIRKVLYRTFSYPKALLHGSEADEVFQCYVNLVVEDMPEEEKGARLKE
jgi:hypothetical protein